MLFVLIKLPLYASAEKKTKGFLILHFYSSDVMAVKGLMLCYRRQSDGYKIGKCNSKSRTLFYSRLANTCNRSQS